MKFRYCPNCKAPVDWMESSSDSMEARYECEGCNRSFVINKAKQVIHYPHMAGGRA